MPAFQQGPDLAGLSDLPFYLNQRGVQAADTAQQFNQLGLQQNQADLAAKGLENLFKEQNNPQLLESQRLANEGAGFDNTLKGVTSRMASELEPEAKAAKRAEYLQKLSDSELKKFYSDAEKDLLGDDEVKRRRAQTKLEGSWSEIQRRSEMQNKIDVAKEQGANRLAVAQTNQAGATERTGMQVQQRREATAARAQASKQPNENFQQAGTRALREAYAATDPSVRQAKMEESQYWLEQDQASQLARNTGKVDVGAVAGVPTVPPPKIPKAPPGVVPQAGPVAQPGVTGNFVGNLEQAARDIQNIKDPQERANAAKALEDQINGRRPVAPPQAAPAAQAPAAPAGKILMYDSKGRAGYVPEAQRDAALQQGYKLSK